MRYMVRAIVIITFSATFFLLKSAQAQAPSPSPAVASSTANAVDKTSTEAEPAPALDFWHQETMTGDWGGTRSRWKEKGIDLEFKYVGIFQSITSGGTSEKGSLTNKLETTWKFDLGKVAGWKYWSSEIKAEWRFGGPALTGTGGVNFTNTAGIIPGASGSVVSVTAVNFTRIIPRDLKNGDFHIVSFGRYNLLDHLEED